MEKQTDIAIIGGGLASFAAAAELEKSGLEVTLVRKAPGAAAISSGGWDLADDPLRIKEGGPDQYPSIKNNIREIIHRNQYHPYTVFSASSLGDRIAFFLEEKTERAAAVLPLTMTGDPLHNKGMITDFGTLKPTAFVQASMAGADLGKMKKAKVLIFGIKGFPQFNATFIHRALGEIQARQEKNHFQFLGRHEIKMPGIPSEASLLPIELALALEKEEIFAGFAKEVSDYIQKKVYTHILFPPILGFSNPLTIVEALGKITGLSVAETLATPMSVPGLRLSNAIVNYFKKQEYDIIEGEAVGFDGGGRKIKSLRIHHKEDRIRLQAKQFILASGKYLGGGVGRADFFKEPIFGLPLFCEGKPIKEQSVYRMSRPESFNPQPFLSAGVAIDSQARVVDQSGNPLYDNLFAAGRVLTGFDSVHDRCSAGVSILSGTIAAQSAVK